MLKKEYASNKVHGLKAGIYFLLENERSEELVKHGLFFGLVAVPDEISRLNEIYRQVAVWQIEDDEKKRKAIIEQMIHVNAKPRLFLKSILNWLRIAIDRLTSKEVMFFLPYLSFALRNPTEDCQVERTLCLIKQMKESHLITAEDLKQHNIVLEPESQIDIEAIRTLWEELLQAELQPTTASKKEFSVLEVILLEKAMSCRGNDKVFSLLMDCISKNMLDGKKQLIKGQLSLFSSLSFALSRVFKKGYPFANSTTKGKIHLFLLSQWSYFCKNASSDSAIHIEIIDLLQFVMTNMSHETIRVQYLEKMLQERQQKAGDAWRICDRIIVMLAAHGMRLHQSELKAQPFVSELESDSINFPKEISAIAKQYATIL